MPRKSRPLTVKEVENAKLEGDAKVKKLYDTSGLHLRINQSGKLLNVNQKVRLATIKLAGVAKKFFYGFKR